MKNTLLNINNLSAGLENGKRLINNLNLTINHGETHVIMGPNGAGKSTLANLIMGHPDYLVTDGSVIFEDENITEEGPDERARKGIFLSFQAPEEVDGITVENFLRTAKTAVSGGRIRLFAFKEQVAEAMNTLDFDPSYAERYLNIGFSGGEKKKNEILQMLVLNPKLAILDETDSGLDVDAVKTVTRGVNSYKNNKNALLIISHSTKLLDELDVDYVHILVGGSIVHTGGRDLIDTINREGFERFTTEEKPEVT